jgi:polyhydroxybutyrate depolymerase
MKHILTIFLAVLFHIFCAAQQTIEGSIMHDGIEREYIIYIPANYTGNIPTPLVINYHGYGSTASEQMAYGDFRSIADTSGFLIVHPQGTLLDGTTHWNVGGWTVGSTVDDVCFTEALIDSLVNMYNIDAARIYATGMSNGGFMSFLLACQLSEKIAAMGSVTGSMTPETYINSNPQHPTPILQIHATTDPVVPYNGASWTKSINEVIEYWVDFNNCNATPVITELPDLDPGDGSTVEHIIYNEGDNGVSVEHFKVIGGGHTWPGSTFTLPGTNYDIDASFEIWKFFSKYDINGLMIISGKENSTEEDSYLKIYPNPTSSIITIESEFVKGMEFELISPMGRRVMQGTITSNHQQIDLSHLPDNIYILKINNRSIKIFIVK